MTTTRGAAFQQHGPQEHESPAAGASYGILIGSQHLAEMLFGEGLEMLAGVPGRAVSPIVTQWDDRALAQLENVDVLVTGWGAPKLTDEIVASLPRLRAIIHAGGATEYFITAAARSTISVVSAGALNAIPVAEYSLAMILLACKQVFRAERHYREHRTHIDRELVFPNAGNYGQTVGLVGASQIGRNLVGLLKPFSLRVVVFDPYLTADDAAALGVEQVSLDELLATSDVVSLHAPLNAETTGMIGARELALMAPGSTLLNTARGGVVDHPALERELVSGRIDAILDVTDPFEPLPRDSPLWDCPNVIITPHVAGSMGTELRRMGEFVASELSSALLRVDAR
ncbi:hydroxyacid dehydrogenase [Salinibacterium sp. G-O1]|uniref:hydroxyacid dehydrogenase n=1 Tax=Salinibacterium sp. G-O1 TaxID=3046208 RepID=UPI0024BB8D38|nr:hydroxyacid dehydrogenase [Salinibacterium sp. G-O1]MDJ0334067.1 hydroxyacid dehydrogenase [Salinibacterium sp. G-O1]